PNGKDVRRFRYAHRMQMVLCDGKHFIAGPNRRKRVALYFLDDATRMVLNVIVGPSESAALFLRGLHGLFLAHGCPDALYVDLGSGFKADDVGAVFTALGRLRIL